MRCVNTGRCTDPIIPKTGYFRVDTMDPMVPRDGISAFKKPYKEQTSPSMCPSIRFDILLLHTLLENGASLLQIKELLGHASIQSTTIYLHLANVTSGIISPLDTFPLVIQRFLHMPELQDIFAQYGKAYQTAHPFSLEQRKVIRAIQNCRTAVTGRTSG